MWFHAIRKPWPDHYNYKLGNLVNGPVIRKVFITGNQACMSQIHYGYMLWIIILLLIICVNRRFAEWPVMSGCNKACRGWRLTLSSPNHDSFSFFYLSIKSLLFGIKWVFKHQCLLIFSLICIKLYNSVCLEVIMFIWEPTSQSDLKTSPSARFSNHPGRDQLSQEGSQINIIADKTHTITIITIIHNVHVDLSL